MSVFSPGPGIADDYWKRYYSPEEAEEIGETLAHTTIPSSGLPIHMRFYLHDRAAPTIIMLHGLLPYGLMLGKVHLAWHRAGFNVVNADLPGFGLSGGPRGGATIPQLIQLWRDVMAFTEREVDSTAIFTAGQAEDSVTSYYTFANDPRVRAMSLHLILEYGDVENLDWLGNDMKIRAMTVFARASHALKLGFNFDAQKNVPWEDVVGPDVETAVGDPLAFEHYTLGLVASMAKPMKPPVRFEDCRTPCQVVGSEKGRLWPVAHNRKAFERLGGPKEWVLLEGAPQWSLRDEFAAEYASNVIRWFREHGAETTAAKPAVEA
jgi:pimeloyl-ACP methyl ester carboxylesterase